jgi:hypothetical protein
MAAAPPPFPPVVTDQNLIDCIHLVQKVSYQAYKYEFTIPDKDSVTHIRHRMANNNWWATWFHPTNGVNIDACAFFQKLTLTGKSGRYVMCIGFDTNIYPMQSDAQCGKFINDVAGDARTDQLLAWFIYQLTPSHFVHVVDNHLTGDPANYNQRLNRLFTVAQSNSGAPGAHWKLEIKSPNGDKKQDDPFLGGKKNPQGGKGLDFWTLTAIQ